MLNSNLILVLKTFTSKEMKELGEFVSSTFYNTNKNVVKLFEILRKYHPRFSSKSLDKKKIFPKIYVDEKYKDSKIRLLIFYLNELAEKFLVNKHLADNVSDYNVYLLKELDKRGLVVSFEKTMYDANKKLNNAVIKDTDYFINKIRTGLLYLDYKSEDPGHIYKENEGDENPEKIFSDITNYYKLMAFELYDVLLVADYLYKYKFKLDAFEKIINEFDKKEYSDYPEILCRYYSCMLWSKPEDESNYYELKEMLETQKEKISLGTMSSAYVDLDNYCVKKIKAGNIKFRRELFEVYKKDLENKFYIEGGIMTHTFYRNVVTVGSGLEEFSWIRNFIEKYKNELHEKMREPVYYYCLAFVETDQKNYEKGLKYLSKVKIDDDYIKIAVRILQCRLFYELNWQEQLNSLVDASKHFLANNKVLSPMQKEFHLGYFKYIHRIIQYKNSASSHKLEMLKQEIEGKGNLQGKIWLLKKISEC